MEYFRGILILSVASIVCCENFISVLTSCRYWDVLAIYSDGSDQRFHCILDQDKVPGIVSTKWTTIPSGYCPIYNRDAKQIDLIPCNSNIGDCPSTLIKSYQAVAFTGCFQMPLARVPSLMNTERSTGVPESDKKDTNSAAENCEDSMHMNIGVSVLAGLSIVTNIVQVAISLRHRKYYRYYKPIGYNDNKQSLIKTEKHTSERTTTCGSSLNIVYHNINKRYASENWVNTAISRSISEPNLKYLIQKPC